MNPTKLSDKRIAFVLQPWDVIYEDQPNTSSLPIVTLQLARRLTPANEVIIYGRQGEGQPATMVDDEGIQYQRFPSGDEYGWLKTPMRIARKLKLPQNPKRPFFSSKYFYRAYYDQVAANLQKSKPDIIHIHNFSQFAPLARRASPQSKIVLHMHCEWLTQLDPVLVEKRLEDVDQVLNCGDFITVNTGQKFPQIAQRIHTLNNGVNTVDFAVDEPLVEVNDGAVMFLFVGRLSPEKGVHVLIDAFHKLTALYPAARLDIIGPPGTASYDFIVGLSDNPRVKALDHYFTDGRYYELLQEKIKNSGAGQIRLLGKKGHAEVMTALRQSHVFIFPIIWDEPFGMPVVEAMMNQTAVIASRSGGIVDIIQDGQTGLLIEPGSVEALATAMEKLVMDTALRGKIAQAGYADASRRFSWQLISAQLTDYYKLLLEDGRS